MSKKRIATYKDALKSISARTGTPLPSLILSFGILHELTALVPLVGIFYGSKTLGVGERLVSTVLQNVGDENPPVTESEGLTWAKRKMRSWIEEGDRWAIKIGRKYGVFGYEKKSPGSIDDIDQMTHVSGHLAGDVANAVFAYGVTKALLPVRIGVSIYFAPMFSRGVLLPIRRTVIELFRKHNSHQ